MPPAGSNPTVRIFEELLQSFGVLGQKFRDPRRIDEAVREPRNPSVMTVAASVFPRTVRGATRAELALVTEARLAGYSDCSDALL